MFAIWLMVLNVSRTISNILNIKKTVDHRAQRKIDQARIAPQ
jgi:hypothetical protein